MLANGDLTMGGLVVLLISVTAVTGLVIWCFYRVLTLPPDEAPPPPPPGFGP